MYTYLGSDYVIYGPFETEEAARADAARAMRTPLNVFPYGGGFPSARGRRTPRVPQAPAVGSWEAFLALGQ